MSLTVAYNIARDGLSTTSAAASVVSRNVANAENPNSSRKSALIVAQAGGSVHLEQIVGAVDGALLAFVLETASSSAELGIISAGLDRLDTSIGDPAAETSPAALIGRLVSTLQLAASAPHDENAAAAVLSAAQSLTGALNETARLIADVRSDAEAFLGEAAVTLSDMLQDFRAVNQAIVAGSAQHQDVTDAVDRRNALVRDIAQLVDIRPNVRAGNDMMLFTANGATLFETTPREISFRSAGLLGPGQSGGALTIDGIPVRSGDGVGGQIGGLLRIRDDLAMVFERQADEIARGLIAATVERDQSSVPSRADLAGLFTVVGGAIQPAAPGSMVGSAGLITVSANADPARGGALSRLRDGGISAPADIAYSYNPSGAPGFGGRLLELIDRLSEAQSFDPATGIATSQKSVRQFSSDSVGWLERERSVSRESHANEQVRVERATGAWQNRVGTNVDDEMVILIGLQRSFQASSHLIATVNSMFDALLAATE